MNCSVYHSKTYLLALMGIPLAFILGLIWLSLREHPLPPLFIGFIAFFVMGAAAATVAALTTQEPVVRVDETGIYYRRNDLPVIVWEDIIAVERPPLIERMPNGFHVYLRDSWRPLRITVRNPEKYLSRTKMVLRQKFPSLVATPDRTQIEIDCSGLSLDSGSVLECVRHHLSQRGVAL